VVCEDDLQWYELVERLGRPEWATGPALATLVGRKAAEGEIDRRLAAWTAERDVADVVRLLQGAVAVAPVNPPGALHDDPQLQHLGYFEVAEHTVMGPQRYNGLQARLSRTPGRVRKAAPCLGEDTLMILRDLLGCDDDEIGELLASDAVEINLEE
jgi:crotonobetainyl-CoA:carnitine CoA-transferase CaiB-like acyl-CoA transferase